MRSFQGWFARDQFLIVAGTLMESNRDVSAASPRKSETAKYGREISSALTGGRISSRLPVTRMKRTIHDDGDVLPRVSLVIKEVRSLYLPHIPHRDAQGENSILDTGRGQMV
jgi:hypothetical protein